MKCALVKFNCIEKYDINEGKAKKWKMEVKKVRHSNHIYAKWLRCRVVATVMTPPAKEPVFWACFDGRQKRNAFIPVKCDYSVNT